MDHKPVLGRSPILSNRHGESMIVRLCTGACAFALLIGATGCDRSSPSSDAPGADAVTVAEAATTAGPPPAPAGDGPTAQPGDGPGAPSAPGRPAPLVITQAQVTAEHSGAMEKCLEIGDAAKGVTPAMAACINAELQMQDARLNTAYREAMGRLDAAGRARLQTEERAWIRQRDEGCSASATGGTIDRLESPSCVLDETIRRRLVLEAVAS